MDMKPRLHEVARRGVLNNRYTAVYENGLLRPLTPLNLADGQIVRLQVLLADTPLDDESAAAERVLVAAGLKRPRPETIPPAPISDAERRELADQLGRLPGKPLSEIIIEDRGEE